MNNVRYFKYLHHRRKKNLAENDDVDLEPENEINKFFPKCPR